MKRTKSHIIEADLGNCTTTLHIIESDVQPIVYLYIGFGNNASSRTTKIVNLEEAAEFFGNAAIALRELSSIKKEQNFDMLVKENSKGILATATENDFKNRFANVGFPPATTGYISSSPNSSPLWEDHKPRVKGFTMPEPEDEGIPTFEITHRDNTITSNIRNGWNENVHIVGAIDE